MDVLLQSLRGDLLLKGGLCERLLVLLDATTNVAVPLSL